MQPAIAIHVGGLIGTVSELMRRIWQYCGLIGTCLAALASPAWAGPDATCFARALPAGFRGGHLDDVKFLIGFVFDVAASGRGVPVGVVVDRGSGFGAVPGFAGATDLGRVAGRYRVMRAPFDEGRGYFGVLLGSLDGSGRVEALILANRLFRLPVVLRDPGGVATDVVTNVAMWTGWWTRAVEDANRAAADAAVMAARMGVPLVFAGQSQAGGVAQLQAAYVAASYPRRPIVTGFITFNGGAVGVSTRRLGLVPEEVEGINFLKDRDPGFGPDGVLASRAGLRVFIHADGSGSGVPGRQSFLAPWLHPGEHLLASFDDVALAPALAAVLAGGAGQCVSRVSGLMR